MMRRALLTALLVLAPLAGFYAVAQTSQPAPDTYTVDDLKRVEAERDEAMKRLKRLEREGQKAARASAEVDRDMLAAAADSQRREEQAGAAETRLVGLNAQVEQARSDLIRDRAALDDLLAALMTFGAHRPPALAASPEDAGQAVRAAILMGDVAPALSTRAKELSERIDRLNALVEDVKREKATLAEADQALAARRQEIDALAEEKRLARVSLDTETSRLKAETDRLGREADTLHDLLDGLAAAAPSAPSTKPSQTASTSPGPAGTDDQPAAKRHPGGGDCNRAAAGSSRQFGAACAGCRQANPGIRPETRRPRQSWPDLRDPPRRPGRRPPRCPGRVRGCVPKLRADVDSRCGRGLPCGSVRTRRHLP